jgi:hypothetical protein
MKRLMLLLRDLRKSKLSRTQALLELLKNTSKTK